MPKRAGKQQKGGGGKRPSNHSSNSSDPQHHNDAATADASASSNRQNSPPPPPPPPTTTNPRHQQQQAAEAAASRRQNPATVAKAAQTIGRFWKRSRQLRTTEKYVHEFLNTQSMTIETVKSISFEALTVRLRELPVIQAARACLQRIHLLSTYRHGSPSRMLSPETVNVRVFLAGFMIAYRPTHVFENMGTLEQALYERATMLMPLFERICEAYLNTPSERKSFADVPHDLTSGFAPLLFEYLKAFKAWKVPDEAKLTCRIKHALIALYQAEEHLPPDEPDNSKLRIEFCVQIERLRDKLRQIAGVEALHTFDEQRRSGGHPVIDSAGAGDNDDEGRPPQQRNTAAYASLPGRVTNEQLAHELLLDPAFQLDESGGTFSESPVMHRIRESFHQAFWDSLVDDLKLATPCYVRVLRVLAEIRDGINDLAGSRESGALTEAVDLVHIRTQAEQGLYTWDSCRSLIAAIVAVIMRVQAPKRDDDTKALWKKQSKALGDVAKDPAGQPRALCKALEFLLDRVNVMRVDAANARLRLIGPVVKDHGIDYERGKFKDKLDSKILSTVHTEAWLMRAMDREIKLGTTTADDLMACTEPLLKMVVHGGIARLITDTDQATLLNAPETLAMDQRHLQSMREEYEYLVSAMTLAVMAKHFSKQSNTVPEEVMAALLANDSKRTIDIKEDLAVIEHIVVKHNADVLKTPLDAKQLDMLRLQLRGSALSTDAVNQLIRLSTTKMFDWLIVPSRGEKMRPTKAEETRIQPIMPRLQKIADRLMKHINLNVAVHTGTYNSIIEKSAKTVKQQQYEDAMREEAEKDAGDGTVRMDEVD